MNDYSPETINHYVVNYWIFNPELMNPSDYSTNIDELVKLDEIDLEDLIAAWRENIPEGAN